MTTEIENEIKTAAARYEKARATLEDFEVRRAAGEPASRTERAAVNHAYQEAEAVLRTLERVAANEADDAEPVTIVADGVPASGGVGEVG